MSNKIGERIKELRISNRYTQLQLADLLGVHQTMISYVEQGTATRPYDVLKKAAPVLGISHEEVVQLILDSEFPELANAPKVEQIPVL